MVSGNGLAPPAGNDDLACRNRCFYDRLWTDAELIGADRFATWTLVRTLLPDAPDRLEIGPGLRPRLPLAGTTFLDLSGVALARLRAAGARAVHGTVTALPFPDACFGLVAALDIVEHVADDEAAWAELARVARPGAVLLVSVPLHASAWTRLDDLVGHGRRYEPPDLWASLATHGFTVERHTPFGMQPRSERLTTLGMWFLARMPGHAMQWYNRVFYPLALRRQPVLALSDGVPETAGVAEIFLVCRKVT